MESRLEFDDEPDTRKAVGAVVRVPGHTSEKFVRGDWWRLAWAFAQKCRGLYPEAEVEITKVYD